MEAPTEVGDDNYHRTLERLPKEPEGGTTYIGSKIACFPTATKLPLSTRPEAEKSEGNLICSDYTKQTLDSGIS